MMRWWCADNAFMHWWCIDDALIMHWWCTDDGLVMHWWCADDALMMRCWCTDDALMMHWWSTYDALMMSWWCPNDAISILVHHNHCHHKIYICHIIIEVFVIIVIMTPFYTIAGVHFCWLADPHNSEKGWLDSVVLLPLLTFISHLQLKCLPPPLSHISSERHRIMLRHLSPTVYPAIWSSLHRHTVHRCKTRGTLEQETMLESGTNWVPRKAGVVPSVFLLFVGFLQCHFGCVAFTGEVP